MCSTISLVTHDYVCVETKYIALSCYKQMQQIEAYIRYNHVSQYQWQVQDGGSFQVLTVSG